MKSNKKLNYLSYFVVNSMVDTEQNIRDHISKVQNKLNLLIDALKYRGETHDASKLQEPELSGFKAMDITKQYPYGSKEYFQKLELFRDTLAHHYSLNAHHPEYYDNIFSKMSLIDLIEMLSDWASYKENMTTDEAISLIEQQQERFNIPPVLSYILLNTLNRYLVSKPDESKDPLFIS